MATITLDEARKDIAGMAPGTRVAFVCPEGRARIGTVKIKSVRCNKEGCTKCPHKAYAYAQYRVGGKVTEKYIGKVL